MRYHPRLGHAYMPNAKLRVQGASGGYLVRTNAAGFRSDHEFAPQREPGAFRALLFGDSQSAGDGTSNALRYSDLLQAAIPGLEVDNCAVSGSATDQQFLAYEAQAARDHDLVVIAVYVENVLRNPRRVVKARDASGDDVFRAKPYYELVDGRLALRGVPVPRQPWTEATLPESLREHVYSYGDANFFFRKQSRRHATLMRALAPLRPLRQIAKAALARWRTFQPLPAYDSPTSPGWSLMRSILTTWIASSRVPVLVIPLPHDSTLAGLSDPSAYQARFRELAAATGCRLFDPLPALMTLSPAERQALWSDAYGHLSTEGHAVIARLLAPVLQGLMREHGAGTATTNHTAQHPHGGTRPRDTPLRLDR